MYVCCRLAKTCPYTRYVLVLVSLLYSVFYSMLELIRIILSFSFSRTKFPLQFALTKN